MWWINCADDFEGGINSVGDSVAVLNGFGDSDDSNIGSDDSVRGDSDSEASDSNDGAGDQRKKSEALEANI